MTPPRTPPLAEWEQELLAVPSQQPVPAVVTEEPAALAEILAAVRQAYTALPADDFRWERGMIRAAAEEAMSYPDPAALVPAILSATRPGRYAALGEYWDRTASGCQSAARAGVRALAASLGQEQRPAARYGLRIGDAARETIAGNGGTT